MPNKGHEKKHTAFALRLIGDIWATIAAPVALLAIFGRRMDVHFGTKPYLLIAGIGIAFVISVVGVCQKAVKYGELYEQLIEDPGSGKDGPVLAVRPDAEPPPDQSQSSRG